eukprot:1371917-Pyramimonas_sp.AAC.1
MDSYQHCQLLTNQLSDASCAPRAPGGAQVGRPSDGHIDFRSAGWKGTARVLSPPPPPPPR